MPPIPYNKPALTFSQQLQQLKSRGLIVDDDAKALFLLENISYYRLSGYWYPLLQDPKSSHIFKPNTNFSLSFQLYCFDKELRKLIGAELEKIEVSIRAKMIYTLSHRYSAFWIEDSTLFSNGFKFNQTKSKITEEYNRSREDFILAFKNNYSNPLPPSWMILEVSSFGVLSNLYQNLKPSKTKREIANYYGLDDSTFASWLHSIVYIRNVCAHHSRLWNKTLSIAPSLPLNPINTWLNTTTLVDTRNGAVTSINNRTYCLLSMILYFLQTVSPNNTFKQKLQGLFDKYTNVDPAAMGFTPNWKSEPMWHI